MNNNQNKFSSNYGFANNRKPCIFFAKGNCKFGDNCRDLHNNQNNNFNNNNGYKNNSNNVNKNFNTHNNINYFNNNKNHNFKQANNKPPYNRGGYNKTQCIYFLKETGCNNKNCHYNHNYHSTLHHVTKQIIQDDLITGCCATCKYTIYLIFIT